MIVGIILGLILTILLIVPIVVSIMMDKKDTNPVSRTDRYHSNKSIKRVTFH